MARNGSAIHPSGKLPIFVADTTTTPALLRNGCIFFREDMSVHAMRHGFLFSAVRQSTKRKPSKIVKFGVSQNLLKRHAEFSSMNYRVWLASRCCGEVAHKMRFPLYLNANGIAAVSKLLSARSPSAIFGAVISVIIDAFKLTPLWSFAHVFSEVGKRVFPSPTNFNPPAAVVFVLRCIGIKAPLLHSDPDSVAGRRNFVRHIRLHSEGASLWHNMASNGRGKSIVP